MAKYFLATIGVLCLLPMIASAAVSDLIFSADTNVYLTGPALTLTITNGSRVDAMSVYPTYVSFDMLVGSVVTVRSADRKILTANPAIATGVCGTSFSYITLQPDSAQTVTVTPGATCAVAPPGGGGGAAAPAPPPTVAGEGTVTPIAGGQASATTAEGGGAAVTVPADAVTANTVVAVTPTATTATAVTTAVATVPSGQSIVGGYVYNLAATAAGAEVTTFAKSVTVTFTYTDAQVAGLNESTLAVHRWNATTSQWVALPSTVNTATNTVTATTTQFSYFALIGSTTVGEEEEEEEEEVVPVVTVTAAQIKAQMIDLIKQIIALITQLIAELQAQLAAMQT